jgi:competence ComEA-like helix-hairpin-helix protein
MAQPAKLDVNTATHEALVQEAGVRPAIADAILKHREANGPFADIEALIAVPGIGNTMLQKLKASLFVAAEAAPMVEAPAVEPAAAATEIAAEAAAAPLEIVAEAAPAIASAPVLKVVEAAPPVVEVAPAPVEPAKPAAPVPVTSASGDLASLWLSLATEQMNNGVEAWKALATAKSWREAMDVQSAYLRASMTRLVDGSQRCVQLASKVVGSLVAFGQKGARKAV